MCSPLEAASTGYHRKHILVSGVSLIKSSEQQQPFLKPLSKTSSDYSSGIISNKIVMKQLGHYLLKISEKHKKKILYSNKTKYLKYGTSLKLMKSGNFLKRKQECKKIANVRFTKTETGTNACEVYMLKSQEKRIIEAV